MCHHHVLEPPPLFPEIDQQFNSRPEEAKYEGPILHNGEWLVEVEERQISVRQPFWGLRGAMLQVSHHSHDITTPPPCRQHELEPLQNRPALQRPQKRNLRGHLTEGEWLVETKERATIVTQAVGIFLGI